MVHAIPPSVDGFTGNTVGNHTVAGRSDGDVFKGIEPRLGFKQSFECQTAFFQEAHVRFAIGYQFFLEIKHHVLVALRLMPPFKFLASFGGHGFGHVVIEGRDGSHVVLMLREVELVGEVPFCQFRQSKGFGKGGQRHLEEAERIDEADAIVFDFQQFAPVPELFGNAIVVVVLMDDKAPIVPLEIMSQHIDLTRVVQREGIQPFEKISETMFAWETNGAIVVFGFGHDQIGDMLFLGLHGFNVKKHVQGWCVVHVVVCLLLRFMGL